MAADNPPPPPGQLYSYLCYQWRLSLGHGTSLAWQFHDRPQPPTPDGDTAGRHLWNIGVGGPLGLEAGVARTGGSIGR